MARYLEVAEAELDNNSTEHSLRAVVLGRRNWLHVGQEAGGEKAANLFSLMITCKRLGVEPYAYLHDVLRRLPSHPNKDIWQLTPTGWKVNLRAQNPAARPQRLNPSDARPSSQRVPSPRETTRRPVGLARLRRTVTKQLRRNHRAFHAAFARAAPFQFHLDSFLGALVVKPSSLWAGEVPDRTKLRANPLCAESSSAQSVKSAVILWGRLPAGILA